MEKNPMTITQDNPAQAWETVDTIRRKAKKTYACSRVASFFSNLVFMALVLLTANGLICELAPGSYSEFLKEILKFDLVWESYLGLYRAVFENWQILLIAVVGMVFAVPFLVSAVAVLLTLAIYHPFKRKQVEEEPKEVAEKILSMARSARRYSNRSRADSSMLCGLLFMIVQTTLLALYLMMEPGNLQSLLEVITKPTMALVGPYLKTETAYYSFQNSMFTPSLILSFLGAFLVYAGLNQIHMATVRFMYRFHVPYSFVAQAEQLHVFAGQAENSADNLDQKVEAALEYERLGAYGRAKELLAEAAHGGNADGMEHYARHWLIIGAKDPARYWLEKCVESGNASETAVKTLQRLKWRRKIRAAYLKRT